MPSGAQTLLLAWHLGSLQAGMPEIKCRLASCKAGALPAICDHSGPQEYVVLIIQEERLVSRQHSVVLMDYSKLCAQGSPPSLLRGPGLSDQPRALAYKVGTPAYVLSPWPKMAF